MRDISLFTKTSILKYSFHEDAPNNRKKSMKNEEFLARILLRLLNHGL